ncbi:Solitary outer membrane autotransporter beta-barrel domain [uncultured Gilvimarinus sp.]|uniref:Solitary outer membrane autotransporter beta-barrel domain n=1 Tax=uncultured Gilvimarinus sp. TaxID=1689143 RepID=UPI0030EBEA26|tara:strand:+ start:11546 stop:12238 length:693 start_codon:yes stop_codon:yes gene_type:complete
MCLVPRVINKSLLFTFGCVLCTSTFAQSVDDLGLGDIVGDTVSQNSARSIVLSDANLVTLGVMDFDPNEFVELDNINAGEESTLEQRSQLTIYSLPWSFKKRQLSDRLSSQAQLRLSYISFEQDLIFDDETVGNPLDETTYLLYAENNWRYQLNDAWSLQAGLGTEVLFYDNNLSYRDSLLQQLGPYLDGSLFIPGVDRRPKHRRLVQRRAIGLPLGVQSRLPLCHRPKL